MSLITNLASSHSESVVISNLSMEIYNQSKNKNLDLKTAEKIKIWREKLDILSENVFDEAFLLVNTLSDFSTDKMENLEWELGWLKRGFALCKKENSTESQDRKKALKDVVKERLNIPFLSENCKQELENLFFGRYV